MTDYNFRSKLHEYAEDNRRNPTSAEFELCAALKAQPQNSAFHPFVFQHPISGFIADFFFPSSRLIVELDGSSHRGREAADNARTAVLRRHGCTVLRFWNSHVFKKLPSVLSEIQAALAKRKRVAVAIVKPDHVSESKWRKKQKKAKIESPEKIARKCAARRLKHLKRAKQRAAVGRLGVITNRKQRASAGDHAAIENAVIKPIGFRTVKILRRKSSP